MKLIYKGIVMVLLLSGGSSALGANVEMTDTLDWNSGLNRETTDPEIWERNERLSGRSVNESADGNSRSAVKTKKKPVASKVLPDRKPKQEKYAPKEKALNENVPESRGDDWVRPDDYRSNIDAANRGEAEAQRIVARCYMSGIGVVQDYNEAWKWMARAAGSADLEAEYQLGIMYRDGLGVKKSTTEAAYWFRKSARNGHPLGLLNLGHAFENGEGVLPDNRVAAENYWRSAERGNAEGAYRYASMLKEGRGVNMDLSRALKYYTQAAEAGYGDAEAQAAALKRQGVTLPSKPVVKSSRQQSKSSAKGHTGKKSGGKATAKKKRR